jgi:hypothetical protein
MGMGTTPDFDIPHLVERLCKLSVAGHYNVFTRFKWPDALQAESGRLWMTDRLLTAYDTPLWRGLSDEQRERLSRLELINFFSINVYGIRDLILGLAPYIDSSEYAEESEYLHHFIGEENGHQWFFAHFCRRYEGRLYQPVALSAATSWNDSAIDAFLVFARVVLFEEVVDHYNLAMAQDDSLPPLVREINAVHHEDESRHIAFGRRMAQALHHRVLERHGPEKARELHGYLERYLWWVVEALFNPKMYTDAKLEGGYQIRRTLLADPTVRERLESSFRRPRRLINMLREAADEVAPPAAG